MNIEEAGKSRERNVISRICERAKNDISTPPQTGGIKFFVLRKFQVACSVPVRFVPALCNEYKAGRNRDEFVQHVLVQNTHTLREQFNGLTNLDPVRCTAVLVRQPKDLRHHLS